MLYKGGRCFLSGRVQSTIEKGINRSNYEKNSVFIINFNTEFCVIWM